jgi:signal transduction histidine kinase
MLYRIFQEALTNVGKHAQAKQISLGAQAVNGTVFFYAEDDGKGFDIEETLQKNPSNKGLGLVAMHERVRMLGRDLSLESQKGKGTRISFSIPVENPSEK